MKNTELSYHLLLKTSKLPILTCSKGLGETSQLQVTKIMVFETSALVYNTTAHPCLGPFRLLFTRVFQGP